MLFKFNRIASGGLLGFWVVSSLPTALAGMSWDICTKDETGVTKCTRRVPRAARLTIAICCFIILVLLFAFAVYIFTKRRKSQEQEYDVEATQVSGPPTIVATEYHPSSGLSGIYTSGPAGNGTVDKHFPEQEMVDPTNPAPTYAGHRVQYTAPISQTTFSGSPFVDDSKNASEPPKTAYVTNGFPRPLLAGNRLKDRLKERPASSSGLQVPVPPPPY